MFFMINLSIKRPVFIICIFSLVMVIGAISMFRLSVDNFPDVTFPVVRVLTAYPGAGPREIETLVSKPLEEEISSIGGIKTVRSINQEGTSIVVAEFKLETDIKYAEQQVRDRVDRARRQLPDDIEEPTVSRIDPADQPIIQLSVESDLPTGDLFDLADQIIKPRIEQVDQVGLVEIFGGRKREVRVELDLNKISSLEVPVSMIKNRLAVTGRNTPAGKFDQGEKTTSIRTLGEYRSLEEISAIPISYANFANPIKVSDVATVKEGLEDEKTRTFINGKQGLVLVVYRQSGANTVRVVDSVKARVEQINKEIAGKGKVTVVQDGAKPIRNNIYDVNETIIIGIILTVVVVFFFLASFRSTLITSLALPNSLLGAFILMAVAGFSINVMTLLALSLAVGLLIDDAIVVRENIFRHLEMGKSPVQASLDGTKEVLLAVIATTMTVIAVFGPIGFLQGVVGQFFKEFGITVCFAMLISLFDAVTMAPMMSAHMAGGHGHGEKKKKALWPWLEKYLAYVEVALKKFDRFQTYLEDQYVKLLQISMNHKKKTIGLAVGIFFISLVSVKFINKTFLPPADLGEFIVALDMPPGTSLDRMSEVALQAEKTINANKEVAISVLRVGDAQGAANKAEIFVSMVPSKQRKLNTTQFKDKVREDLKALAYANPIVKDAGGIGGQRPMNLNISGSNPELLEKTAKEVFEKIKHHPALQDPDISYRPGKPEIQVDIDPVRAAQLGVLNAQIGDELRGLIEGVVPAVYRRDGFEYDVRVRLRDDQRDIKKYISNIRVPNMNNQLTYLKLFADVKEADGPTTIDRQDRIRYISIASDIAAKGPGMGAAIADINKLLTKDSPLPPGMSYKFVGQAENFQELMINMLIAMVLGVLFIYMVLASLYESFVTPITIMVVLPLAACGAFFGLLITRASLDIFSMIGCIMLLGIATKNSIILVDYITQMEKNGMARMQAILAAGKTRLRPILMTSFALIAGMLPVAIGLNEASKQRTSMGIAIIGGLVSSTLLTLVVVPIVYIFIEGTKEKLQAWWKDI